MAAAPPARIERQLREAEAAASRGDGGAARRLLERAVAERPRDPAVLYRAGVLAGRLGDPARARRLLAAAAERAPDDAAILGNLGLACQLLGDAAAAIRHLEAARRAAPRARGLLQPLATAYAALGDEERAERLYGDALAADPRDLAARNNLAVLLQRQGRLREAVETLLGAERLGPPADLLSNLGNLLKEADRIPEALERYRRALKLAPASPAIRRNLAIALRDGGDGAAALAAVRRAVVLAPGEAEGLALVAELLERRDRLEEAMTAVRRALAAAPDDPAALRLEAAVLRRAGQAGAALGRLEAAVGRLGEHPAAWRLHFEAAALYDRLGDAAAAHAALVRGHALQLARPPARLDPERPHRQIAALRAVIADDEPADDPEAPDAAGSPVFLIGFPRSGTTLLDQILDAHPAIQVLEERPLVVSAVARLGERYPAALPSLSFEEIRGLRVAYLADRDRYLALRPGATFVDKMPLNIVHVALTRRLFPHARYILALRHPCDVCLSCFMQAFQLNDWMANFASLEGTARLYRAVFGLWALARERYRLPHHVVRYESLVGDLEGEVTRLLGFLGLPWDAGMAAFHERARSRGHLATPSYSQVTSPLYSSSRGRWRRYHVAMDPVARALAEEIRELGYGEVAATEANE